MTELLVQADTKAADAATAVVIVTDSLSALQDDDVKAKVPHVTAEALTSARKRVTSEGGSSFSAPLHTDAAWLFNCTYKGVTRHNCVANPLAFEKFVKNFYTSTREADRSVAHFVLRTKKEHQLPLLSVIARLLPAYNAKTGKSSAQNEVLKQVVVELCASDAANTAEEARLAERFCAEVRRCGRLVDMPANYMHCDALVKEAEAVADELEAALGQKGAIKRTIIRGEHLRDKGFGGIWNVGKASLYPPALVSLSYTPPGSEESDSYALVGKGIVFDTGGTSLKPKVAMPTMKIDMGGSAALLAAFSALVHAKIEKQLHCVLCIAENHIGPMAQRPDDVITMLSGKTVEVNNTDAEGRLVLADGVYYARHTLNAHTIINMCTLTGMQKNATGAYHALIISNSHKMEQQCVAAGRRSGDLCHANIYSPELFMPDLRSMVADMKNSNLGNVNGPPSAIAAHFIGDNLGVLNESDIDGEQKVVWLHVDMASLSGMRFVQATHDERSTAYGVALICSLLGTHTAAKALFA